MLTSLLFNYFFLVLSLIKFKLVFLIFFVLFLFLILVLKYNFALEKHSPMLQDGCQLIYYFNLCLYILFSLDINKVSKVSKVRRCFILISNESWTSGDDFDMH